MKNYDLTISFPCDSDGFNTLQCHYCDTRFKLATDDLQNNDFLYIFCPYCGLQDEISNFLPDEVIEQADILAGNMMKTQINQLMQDLEKRTRSNKHIKFKAGKKIKMKEDVVFSDKENWNSIGKRCCEHQIKVSQPLLIDSVYCPFCGVN